jgi:hypothetical protein
MMKNRKWQGENDKEQEVSRWEWLDKEIKSVNDKEQ